MHPVISTSVYTVLQIIFLGVVLYCLRSFRELHVSEGLLRALSWIVAVVSVVLIILPIAGAYLPPGQLKRHCEAAGNIWLGFSIYFHSILLILLLIAGIVRLIAKGQPAWVRPAVLLVSFAAGAVILVLGMRHAQDTIVTNFDVTIEKDAGGRSDMKMVLIADLHISVNSHLETIQKMADEINEIGPDVVVVAGDIFTSEYRGVDDPEAYAAALASIKAPEGVYAVYGNHDVEETLFGGFPITPISQAFRTKEMEQFFKDANFKVLYDETAELFGGDVQLVGRIDGEKAGDGTKNRMSAAGVLAGEDLKKPVIVLQHEPIEFKALAEAGADLVLCGHTHAGQIFPGNVIVPFFNENAYGYELIGGVDTVVTSGIGYYGPPMRVGTNSEIAVVNIHFEGA